MQIQHTNPLMFSPSSWISTPSLRTLHLTKTSFILSSLPPYTDPFSPWPSPRTSKAHQNTPPPCLAQQAYHNAPKGVPHNPTRYVCLYIFFYAVLVRPIKKPVVFVAADQVGGVFLTKTHSWDGAADTRCAGRYAADHSLTLGLR